MQAALDRFAQAYTSSTGATLAANDLQLRDDCGTVFGGIALLPCGFPTGTDFFVSSDDVPSFGGGTTRTSDASVAPTATHVTAKEGSAIAASQAKMGEHSYYYSVGKAGDPARPPVRGSGPVRSALKCLATPAARRPH